jgi:hypothetical protein
VSAVLVSGQLIRNVRSGANLVVVPVRAGNARKFASGVELWVRRVRVRKNTTLCSPLGLRPSALLIMSPVWAAMLAPGSGAAVATTESAVAPTVGSCVTLATWHFVDWPVSESPVVAYFRNVARLTFVFYQTLRRIYFWCNSH